jgi:serine/threonine-protein kinase HipA
MRRARVLVENIPAGILEELERGARYRFQYDASYGGRPVSLSMPVEDREFTFEKFPAFFDGVLPEGIMLESLLRQRKIDRDDLFGQLVAVGKDLVGAVTVEELAE